MFSRRKGERKREAVLTEQRQLSGSKVVRKYESDDDGDVLCDVGCSSVCALLFGYILLLYINTAFLLIMGISVLSLWFYSFFAYFIARDFIDVSSFHLRCGGASSSSSSKTIASSFHLTINCTLLHLYRASKSK